MMFPASDLVHYVCIARDTTVLAEFNSKDEKLGSIAEKCLEKKPPFHSTFSHTVRFQTYAFLIDDPFVYFAIFDEKLEKFEGLGFLRSVKKAFDKIFQVDLGKKKLERLSSHCFQGEFNPVFHRLLGQGPGTEPEPEVRRGERLDQSGSFYSGSGYLGMRKEDSLMNLKKKMNRLFGDFKIGSGSMKGKGDVEKKVDIGGEDDDRGGILLSREFSVAMHKNGMYSGELMGNHNHHKAKKVWKKQVWIVLSLDLFVCTVLFIVWLCVCRGFKCIDS
ncbi:phytolongin -like [Olea europaea subsp. europaea]|uniref:Phytolongin -like n=1 Tax=Olea europaea subsp. europaea TaxID=158383 RepID=A0A8S0U2N7_OLEEU|nr:phytolongin -like [Olea europaea subsp. europaea]